MDENRQARSETEVRIIEAAIAAFVRYGPKKTAMADIAEAAGVSRQTVYSSFRDKDGIIVACVEYISESSLANLHKRLENTKTIEEQLTAYLEETVLRSFELLKEAGDPEDLISGHSIAGKAAIKASHARQAAVIEELLQPFAAAIAQAGQTPTELANYVVTVAMGLKYATEDRRELDKLMHALVTSVSAVVQQDARTNNGRS